MKKTKWIMPPLVMIGILVVILLVTFPMLTMKVKDIPVGIVSLDESTVLGEQSEGEKLITELKNENNPALIWIVYDNAENLEKALLDGKIYASWTIPENYSLGTGKIQVVKNEGINSMVNSSLGGLFQAVENSYSLTTDTSSINKMPEAWGMLSMTIPMLLLIFTFASSLITGVMVTNKITASTLPRKFLFQAIYMVSLSFAIGFLVPAVAVIISGVNIAVGTIGLMLSLVALAIMLLANGAINLIGKSGMLVPSLLFMLGMATVTIAYEFMPRIYQILIASWEPFRYIGNGIREVLFQGKGAINSSFVAILIVALVGILMTALSVLKNKSPKTPKTKEIVFDESEVEVQAN